MAGAAWLLDLLVGQPFNCGDDRDIANVLRINLGVIKGDLPVAGVTPRAMFVDITAVGQDIFGFVSDKELVDDFAIWQAEADKISSNGLSFSVCNHGLSFGLLNPLSKLGIPLITEALHFVGYAGLGHTPATGEYFVCQLVLF